MSRPSALDGAAAHAYLHGSHCLGGYALSVSGATAALTLPAGIYRVWLREKTAGTGVFLKVGAAATVPADGTVDAGVFGFSGGDAAPIYVVIKQSDATKTLSAILTTGTGVLDVIGL